MNENFEKYINDLSPELQEKAKNCTSFEEITELLAENNIEIPEEILEAVSGGGKCEASPIPCPNCGKEKCSSSYNGTFLCQQCRCLFDRSGKIVSFIN